MERSGENKAEIEMDGSGEAFTEVEVETKTETRAEEMEAFGEKVEIGKYSGESWRRNGWKWRRNGRKRKTFIGGTKLKGVTAEAGEFKCGRFMFFFNDLLCFWVEEKEKEEKRKEEIKCELKLNKGIFVISPPICPKCQLFYNQS